MFPHEASCLRYVAVSADAALILWRGHRRALPFSLVSRYVTCYVAHMVGIGPAPGIEPEEGPSSALEGALLLPCSVVVTFCDSLVT